MVVQSQESESKVQILASQVQQLTEQLESEKQSKEKLRQDFMNSEQQLKQNLANRRSCDVCFHWILESKSNAELNRQIQDLRVENDRFKRDEQKRKEDEQKRQQEVLGKEFSSKFLNGIDKIAQAEENGKKREMEEKK